MKNTKREVKIKTIGGRDYAYDMISFWDKETKKYRKKSVYLGVVTNRKTKEYTPKKANETSISQTLENEIIHNIGNTYSIAKTFESSVFSKVIKNILPKDYNTIMILVLRKLAKSSVIQYVDRQESEKYVSKFYLGA